MCKIGEALIAALAIVTVALGAAEADQIRIGVGEIGPISPQAMYEIEQLVAAEPNVHEIPIVPPGDVDACVKRFVAGESMHGHTTSEWRKELVGGQAPFAAIELTVARGDGNPCLGRLRTR